MSEPQSFYRVGPLPWINPGNPKIDRLWGFDVPVTSGGFFYRFVDETGALVKFEDEHGPFPSGPDGLPPRVYASLHEAENALVVEIRRLIASLHRRLDELTRESDGATT